MLNEAQRRVVASALDNATAALKHLVLVLHAYETDLVNDDTPPWFKKLFETDGRMPNQGG